MTRLISISSRLPFPWKKARLMYSITGIRVRSYQLPLRDSWPVARGVQTQRDGLLIELQTAHEPGLGDCAPLPSHGTESIEQAQDFLREIGEAFRGGKPEGLLARLGKARKRFPAACFAVETAALDLIARRNAKTLSGYIAPGAPESVAVNAMIGALDDDVVGRSRTAVDAGYCVVKVKAGRGSVAETLERTRALINTLPSGTALRLDVGGAWAPSEAAGALDALKDLPIECIEEPSAGADLEQLAGLQARVPFPLALDDTLRIRGVDTVIGSRAVKRIVLKPAVIGSIGVTAQLGRRARRSGLQVVVTSALDTGVGVTAAAHAAAAVEANAAPADRQAHGLATTGWLAADLATAPRIADGRLTLPQNPGLGSTLLPSA